MGAARRVQLLDDIISYGVVRGRIVRCSTGGTLDREK